MKDKTAGIFSTEDLEKYLEDIKEKIEKTKNPKSEWMMEKLGDYNLRCQLEIYEEWLRRSQRLKAEVEKALEDFYKERIEWAKKPETKLNEALRFLYVQDKEEIKKRLGI